MAKSKKVAKSNQSVAAETKVRRVEADGDDRSALIRGIIVIAVLILGLFLIYSAFAGDQSGDEAAVTDEESKTEDDEEAKDTDEPKAEESTNGTTVTETDQGYDFVVGEGESYTTMARRAIASADDSLTTAQRVAAETKLAQDAGAEWLNLGQELSLTKENINAAVEWAKGLTDEQQAAWQPYADLVAW